MDPLPMSASSQALSYTDLHNLGITLTDADIRFITSAIRLGCHDALGYLGIQDSSWPKFHFGDKEGILGYIPETDVLNLPTIFLNHVASLETPLVYRDQLLCTVPNIFMMVVKFSYWIRLIGREETVHRYQNLGHSKLKARYPSLMLSSYSIKARIVSDLEVEARQLVDAISVSLDEQPIWKDVDAYLAKQCPEHYGKSLEQMASLPRPIVPISIDLES